MPPALRDRFATIREFLPVFRNAFNNKDITAHEIVSILTHVSPHLVSTQYGQFFFDRFQHSFQVHHCDLFENDQANVKNFRRLLYSLSRLTDKVEEDVRPPEYKRWFLEREEVSSVSSFCIPSFL